VGFALQLRRPKLIESVFFKEFIEVLSDCQLHVLVDFFPLAYNPVIGKLLTLDFGRGLGLNPLGLRLGFWFRLRFRLA